MRIDSFMYEGQLVTITTTNYAGNDRLAIRLEGEDGLPFGTLSVNMPLHPIKDDEFAAKNYSENEKLAVACYKTGCFFDTGHRIQSGFVQLPIWKLLRQEQTDFDRVLKMFNKKEYGTSIMSNEEVADSGRGIALCTNSGHLVKYLFDSSGKFLRLLVNQ